MQTKDAIKFALTVSNKAVLSVIDEMSGAPTTFPTPNGGCHPLWVLGHLALVEGIDPGGAVRRAEPGGRSGRQLLRRAVGTGRRCRPRIRRLRKSATCTSGCASGTWRCWSR